MTRCKVNQGTQRDPRDKQHRRNEKDDCPSRCRFPFRQLLTPSLALGKALWYRRYGSIQLCNKPFTFFSTRSSIIVNSEAPQTPDVVRGRKQNKKWLARFNDNF